VLRARLAAAARARAERYSLAAQARGMLAAYDEAASRHAGTLRLTA
jgi:hypothetical protein